MGCCTQPYLGSGVTSCSGVSVDEACSPTTGPTTGRTTGPTTGRTTGPTTGRTTGPTTGPAEASSATGLVAPVFVLLIAFASYFA